MIQTISILVVSFVCLITSVLLFRRACGSMSPLRLNTVSYIFYFQIIITAFVGSIFLATGSLGYHPYARPISEWHQIESWMWVMYSMIIMPLTMIGFNSFIGVKPLHRFRAYLQTDIQVDDKKSSLIVLSLMTIAALTIIGLIFYKIDRVPLYTLLVEGDAKQAAIDRVSVRYNLGWIDYVKNLFGLMMLPVFAYYAYVIAYKYKTILFYFFFTILFGITVLMLMFDIQKAPVAFFVLGFIILQTILSKGIPLKYFLLFGSIAAALVLGGYQMTTGAPITHLLFNYSSAFYGRMFLTGYFAFPISLEIFPDMVAGTSHYSGVPIIIQNFMGLENTESARLVMMYMNPEGVEAGTANLFSGYYLGEAYANYGYLGLIFAPMLVGVVVQSVHNYLILNLKTPLILAFYTFITVKWLLGSGVVSFLYLKILLFPFVFYLATKFVIGLVIKLRAHK